LLRKVIIIAESKLDDWFVAKYLIHDGETVEEAKARLKAEQVRQEAVYKETAEKRRAKSVAKIGTAADIAKKSV
jgi:hypothetical protein